MNEVTSHVVQALDQIDSRFYGLDDIAFQNGALVDSNSTRNLERRFMIEFSRQYTAIMEKNQNQYVGVEYDFEVPKKFMWYANPDLEIRETHSRLNERRDVDMLAYFEQQPDFVVHAGQRNMDDQRLILEAKVNTRTSKGEAFKDIFHTLIYANKYQFQNSVLMLVNLDLMKWLRWLSEYRDEGFYLGHEERLDHVHIVSKESASASTEVVTLAKYLNA